MKYSVRGAGTPVLFLHGLPTSGRLWDYVVPRLQNHFSCVVVDLPGAGESPPFPDGAFTLEHYAEDLEGLRRELDIPRWHIVGHDAGSASAIHYVDCYSERVGRMVLCSPPVLPEHTIPWFFRLLRNPGLGEILAPFVTSYLLPAGLKMAVRHNRPGLSEIIQAFCRPYAGRTGAQRFLRLLRWGDPAQVLGPTAALLPQIGIPTLVLSGLHDGAVPSRFATRAAGLIPNAQLDLLDCGHLIPLECPEILSSHLLSFLAEPS